MHKPLLFALALSCVAAPAFADTTTHPTTKSAVAPADEYFGRLKMSVLGIANVIKDMRLRVEADGERTPSIFSSLAMVEDAIRDWEVKYPRDSWIPRNLLALEVAYLHASGDRAYAMAIRTEAWLRRDFPRSQYAQTGHTELTRAASQHVTAAAPEAPVAPVAEQR
jgi:hypothetical protein